MLTDDWLSCAAVAKDLARVDAAINAASRTGDAATSELIAHLARLGGKRLRPALLLLARGGARADEAAINAAVAVELIHLASLYHDDVMDRSKVRRGGESANARWGNGLATLGGTLLFGRAMRMLIDLGPDAAEFGARASAALCLGQLKEAENAYNIDLSVENHLAILSQKTGALFVLAVELGCLLGARTRHETEVLIRFANALGMAFQLHDDLLDWCGVQAAMGKAAHTDVAGGIYTLPLLEALARGNQDAQQIALLLRKRSLDRDDVEALSVMVRDNGVAAAEATRGQWAEVAQQAVEVLADGPVRRSLSSLISLSIARRS